MATEIKSIPLLKDKEAENFIQIANENLAKKGTIGIAMDRESYLKILSKAKLK